MRSSTVMILLAFVGSAHAKESMDEFVDKLVSDLVSHLLDLALKTAHLHDADSDDTTLGELCHLVINLRTSLRPLPPLRAQPYRSSSVLPLTSHWLHSRRNAMQRRNLQIRGLSGTPEGAALIPMIGTPSFSDAWRKTIEGLRDGAGKVTSNSANGTSLQARIAEVQSLSTYRRTLSDCMGVGVERCFVENKFELMQSAASFAPGSPLPWSTTTLLRASEHFPGESASQVQTFVTDTCPWNDPNVTGRMDRLQAAQLYMGSMQFGYFVAQVFLGQAHLDDQQVLTPTEARAIQETIQRSAREMKSEVAWMVASRRAGSMMNLAHEAKDSLDGYEQLREFTTGVQAVERSRLDEFFAKRHSDSDKDERSISQQEVPTGSSPESPSAASFLPMGDFIPFNAAGLQALLAEGCLYGWFLWSVETKVRSALGVKGADALLVPTAVRSFPVDM